MDEAEQITGEKVRVPIALKWLETLLITAFFLAFSVWHRPDDPFYLTGNFPWPGLGPARATPARAGTGPGQVGPKSKQKLGPSPKTWAKSRNLGKVQKLGQSPKTWAKSKNLGKVKKLGQSQKT